MVSKAERSGRDFIARHGETVYNVVGRLQSNAMYTPLTRAGFAQAEEMGRAMLALLGRRPALTMWVSPTDRALQTLAVIAEHLDLDWHHARRDARLVEIGTGDWAGQTYAELRETGIEVLDRATGLFAASAPGGGEWYDAIATRVSGWADETASDAGDRLVIMLGQSSRVLRGVLLGLPPLPSADAPIAPGLPQGSISMISDGEEAIVHRGTGRAPT